MEPYLFRQMLLEHIIPEIQSERNSMIYGMEPDDDDEKSKMSMINENEKVEEDSDDFSLNSEDMDNAPSTSLSAVNEKRVKFT